MDERLIFAVLSGLALVGMASWLALRKQELENQHWWLCYCIFLPLLVVCLTAWRWRSLTYNGEINVDESQVLSQAMRYMLDPLPWRSVDGGSSGPLNTWAVLWAPLLGIKLQYLAARVTSVACVCTMFAALVLALREILGGRFAMFLTMPVVCFVFTTTNLDFAFFSSEQLPSALSAVVVYLLIRQTRVPGVLGGYSIGFLTGALPFCKIQAGPAALLLFGAGVAATIYGRGGLREGLKTTGWMALGGLTVPTLILLPVAIGGAWGDFVEFYIKTALGYRNKAQVPVGAGSLIFGVREFGFLVVSVSVLSVVALVTAVVKRVSLLRKKHYGSMLGFAVVYLWVTAFSILKTGYPFPHYLMLLIVPGVSLLGISFKPLFDSFPVECRRESAAVRVLDRVVFLLVACALGGQMYFSALDLSRNKQFLPDWGNGIHPAGEIIQKLVQPGDTIAVWGWAPKFNVMSQTPSALRFSQCMFLLDPAAQERISQVFFDRFFADLVKNRPKLFLDAPDEFVWPEYPHGEMARHWVLPVLSEFVRKNYSIVGTIPSPPGKVPIMVYKRREEAS